MDATISPCHYTRIQVVSVPLLQNQTTSMKKLLFMLMLCSAMVKAQNYAPVEEQVVPMDGVPRNSLTIIIKDAKTEDIKKAWKKQLKDL
ncbi:MAG: hypothetical protein IT253_05825, partial [Chitinophagaceae bacterium]|nr:hypothetical protein [Chitinophagaceae bacterium]